MSGDLQVEEARAFAAFEAAVAAVPRERMEEAVLPDGWTVKDVLWHVAYWWRDGERTFRVIAEGTHAGFDDDEETDVANARVLEESRSRSLQEVEDEFGAARASLLATFALVAGDPTAAELFRSETTEHYEEHLPAVRTLGA